jgi:cation transport ATPase
MGGGLHDVPALTSTTVGIACGQQSNSTAEAAGVVRIDRLREKVDA